MRPLTSLQHKALTVAAQGIEPTVESMGLPKPHSKGGSLWWLRHYGYLDKDNRITDAGHEALERANAAVKRMRGARKRAREVAAELCAKRKICLKDVFTKSRFREHMKVRHEAFMILWAEGFSLAGIGKAFGTEHTTVANGIGTLMLKRGDTDHPFARRVLLRQQRYLAKKACAKTGERSHAC